MNFEDDTNSVVYVHNEKEFRGKFSDLMEVYPYEILEYHKASRVDFKYKLKKEKKKLLYLQKNNTMQFKKRKLEETESTETEQIGKHKEKLKRKKEKPDLSRKKFDKFLKEFYGKN